jgi:tetratricopeptide (TPR) repeat protein
MKAERRHELQQNTLDQALTRAPEAARKYGGMALLVVLAVAAGFLLIRYRINTTRQTQQIARENLATARTNINQLSQLHLFAGVPGQQLVEVRKRWSDDARTALDSITGSATDPKLLAEALVAKGDLNWALAQMNDVPEAATQPSLRLDADPKTLLAAAESAYTEVLTQHADQKDAVIAANFGLAAVYESLGNWDNAKQKYQQILDDANIAEAFRTQAKFRLERAADWSKPVLLAAATQPATQPSASALLEGFTGASQPAAAPATQSTTVPAATQPVER